MKFPNFIFKCLIRKKLIFYSFLTFVFCVGTSFIHQNQNIDDVLARRIVFPTQRLLKTTINDRLLIEGAAYYLFQNTVKRIENNGIAREIYDLIAYVYKSDHTLLDGRKVRLERVTGGVRDIRRRPEDDINTSIYKITRSELDSLVARHHTADTIFFQPEFSFYANHIDYTVYPNTIILPAFTGKDSLEIVVNKIKKYYKKYGRFQIDDDYLYLNPSPPRNFEEDQ